MRNYLKFLQFILLFLLISCQAQPQYFQFCFTPTWSPDGSKIAFLYKNLVANTEYKYTYYTTYSDNLNNRVVKFNEFTGKEYKKLIWSPDGEKLILATKDEFFTIDKNGDFQKKLADGEFPSFSQDSTKIAFTKNNKTEIRLLNILNQSILDLDAKIDGSAFYPCWTNDGNKIQWLTIKTTDSKNIVKRFFILNIYDLIKNTSSQTPMLAELAESLQDSGVWNKTRDKLLFSYNMEIYLLSLDGSHPLKICRGIDPQWSPDNTRIVYSFPISDRYADIYIYDLSKDIKESKKIISYDYLPKE